ncbi:protein FAM13A [Ctenodactylus gundi]
MACEIMPLQSTHAPQVSSVSTTGELLERSIRSAVEQHLFDVNSSGGQSSEDLESEAATGSSSTSTQQRCCQPRKPDEVPWGRDKGSINKENMPSGSSSHDEYILSTQEVEKLHENPSDYIGERSKLKHQKSSSKLSELSENQDGLVNAEGPSSTWFHGRAGPDNDEHVSDESKEDGGGGGQERSQGSAPCSLPVAGTNASCASEPGSPRSGPQGPSPATRSPGRPAPLPVRPPPAARGACSQWARGPGRPAEPALLSLQGPSMKIQEQDGGAREGPPAHLPARGAERGREGRKRRRCGRGTAGGGGPRDCAFGAPERLALGSRPRHPRKTSSALEGRSAMAACVHTPSQLSSGPCVSEGVRWGTRCPRAPGGEGSALVAPGAVVPIAPPPPPRSGLGSPAEARTGHESDAVCSCLLLPVASFLSEPLPAFSWPQEDTDPDEARLSPQAGHLIRQLLDGDSDPLLSPRFYAYGQSRGGYLDDTEVPPSPPDSHPFTRRRSSSLGSCEDEQEDLTPAQLTRRIQSLKKKIRKFEDRFEEERKYRPSHSDKAANPEVLKWTNELARFRKQLKESKLKIPEEDLAPRMRQRSNTLPKSFGSQLEKDEERRQELLDKAVRPSVEATLDSIQKRLQEKRVEAGRPEDIKDMTKDQIANEKVALQKALLCYEGIHGRPATKAERQVMKPLYDRYRLVKQILSRASAMPVIGSPSSKRRSPLLQPIIEGVTVSFFKEIKEDEDRSEDDTSLRPDLAVSLRTDLSTRCFLDQFEDDTDGFISPVDDKMPSKCSQDPGLSNLHAASIPQLLEHLQEMREEKKRIRKKLRDFEDNFFRQNGRTVQKEDRTPMTEGYTEYKHIKAKLRLLEALISKGDGDSNSL